MARLLAVLERQHQAVQGVQPGVGITDAVGLERQEVGVSGQPGESRGILDHEGERRLVAPGPLEPETRHPEHDETGTVGPQRLVVETQLVQARAACSSR